jgi:hypothetical protein
MDYRLLNPPFPIVCSMIGFPNLRYHIDKLLSMTGNILISTGGVEEMFLHDSSDTMRLWINKRDGILKLAIQHEAIIIPCLSPDEDKRFDTYNFYLHKYLFSLYKLTGVPVCMFKLCNIFPPYIPYKNNTTNVHICKPIDTMEFVNLDQVQVLYKKSIMDMCVDTCTPYEFW